MEQSVLSLELSCFPLLRQNLSGCSIQYTLSYVFVQCGCLGAHPFMALCQQGHCSSDTFPPIAALASSSFLPPISWLGLCSGITLFSLQLLQFLSLVFQFCLLNSGSLPDSTPVSLPHIIVWKLSKGGKQDQCQGSTLFVSCLLGITVHCLMSIHPVLRKLFHVFFVFLNYLFIFTWLVD